MRVCCIRLRRICTTTGCGAALLGGMTEEYALLMRATQAAFLESFPQDIAVWNAAGEKFKKEKQYCLIRESSKTAHENTRAKFDRLPSEKAVLYSAQLSLTVFFIYASNEPKSVLARDLGGLPAIT